MNPWQFVLMLGEMPLIHDWINALIFRTEFTARRIEIQAKVYVCVCVCVCVRARARAFVRVCVMALEAAGGAAHAGFV